MNPFIELHDMYGVKTLINIERIVSVQPTDVNSWLDFGADEGLRVRESYAEIQALLQTNC